MATFDFIASDQLRNSLERDFAELITCMQSAAWKAAHVIAGSLIHATLADHVISTGRTTEEEGLQLTLAELLEICREQGVLSQRTLELASFIRPYGDFLSPKGRMHLRIQTDETSARIAQALLEIIISELTGNKQAHRDRTAVHVIHKVLSDPSSGAILSHLVEKLSRAELEELLTVSIPKAYFETAKSTEAGAVETLDRLELCYRVGFDLAPADLKRTFAKRFIEVLENESEFVVQTHQTRFFKGSDAAYLDEEELSVLKSHLFATLEKKIPIALVNALAGMGAFLRNEEETRAFFIPLVLGTLELDDARFSQACFRRVLEEYRLLPPEQRRALASWAGRLRWSLQAEGRAGAAAKVANLESALVALQG